MSKNTSIQPSTISSHQIENTVNEMFPHNRSEDKNLSVFFLPSVNLLTTAKLVQEKKKIGKRASSEIDKIIIKQRQRSLLFAILFICLSLVSWNSGCLPTISWQGSTPYHPKNLLHTISSDTRYNRQVVIQ